MSQADTQDKPSNTLVWCEIPVTDMARAKAFYAEVLEADLIGSNDSFVLMSISILATNAA